MEAVLIAGPNGAGKTTYARQLLSVLHLDIPYLNADEISREAPVFEHAHAAGRELLRRLASLENKRRSFAIETTLASRSYARKIPLWRAAGYKVHLHFIELPTADFAVKRVAERVAAGGHSIPERDIRRRFERGRALFHQVYKPLVDQWYHWSSGSGGLRFIDG